MSGRPRHWDSDTVAAALLADVPPVSPSPGVKTRVMAQVRADASLFDAARDRATAQPATPPPARVWLRPLGRWFRAPLPVAALACTLLLVLAGGALLSSELRSGADGASVLAAQVDRERAPGASGTLELRGEQAELEVRGLPAPEPGRAYQVWVRDDLATPRPANATLRADGDGVSRASVGAVLNGASQLLVTSEPTGGSALPTRPPVLRVDLG